jgi:hypothetical protein
MVIFAPDQIAVNFAHVLERFGAGLFPAPEKRVPDYHEGQMVLARDHQDRMVPARVEEVRDFLVGPITYFVRYPGGWGRWLATNTVGVMIAPLRQIDNTTPRHSATAADIDAESARTVALAMAEEEAARREAEYDRIVEEENRAAYDRFMDELAEERELEARASLVCHA